MSEVQHEECRFCSHSFKDDYTSKICPVCCATRDRYANIAKQTGMTREEVKWSMFVPLTYYGMTSGKVSHETNFKIKPKREDFNYSETEQRILI